MKIVIHAGMHKTGSSSIQDHFFATRYDGIVYPRWAGANHCGLFILLFQDPNLLGQYHGFKARGPDYVASLPALKEEWLSSLAELLDSSAGQTFVLSAEDISFHGFRGAVENMASFFRNWSDDITVVGYARKPLSFVVSAFQQMLKDGGLRSLNVRQIWPHYRQRFLMLEDVFGKDRVKLRPYDRSHLVGGDVVQDFGSLLGLDLGGLVIPEANTSLSAEATALLFAQRHLGAGFVAGFPGAQVGNAAYIEKLRGIGGRKLTFSDALWEPVLQEFADDLAWLEDRIGLPMRDVPDPTAIAISNDDDLIKLAVRSYDDLEKILFDSIRESPREPVEKTLRVLELLRELSYEKYLRQ